MAGSPAEPDLSLLECIHFAFNSLICNRGRTLLMMLAMSIGVASVLVLTSLGEGARGYVVNQFSAVGTHLVIVLPGRNETSGGLPGGLMGQVPREITLEDATALLRIPGVAKMAPLVIGSSTISRDALNREVVVLGSNSELLAVRNMELGLGRFLPAGDLQRSDPVCVLGSKLARELFGQKAPIGGLVRLGDRRFRVIGVLAPQGQSMGFDSDEVVMVPVGAAQQLFNSSGLFRVLLQAKGRSQIESVQRNAELILQQRHQGERDVTVLTQDAVLATFDRIFSTLTLAIAGIAAISLSVAGVLIMNVMLIAVSQRVREIGLLKALGASAAQIRVLFFTEALLLSLLGSLSGLLIGQLLVWLLALAQPQIPIAAPAWALLAAFSTALVVGILFSLLPVQRAAKLDPVRALGRS